MLLTERMKKVLPCIIADFQGAYVHNRQINDGILIAVELIDSRIKGDKSGIVCKAVSRKRSIILIGICVDMCLTKFGFGTL